MAERRFTSTNPTAICWNWSHPVDGASFEVVPSDARSHNRGVDDLLYVAGRVWGNWIEVVGPLTCPMSRAN